MTKFKKVNVVWFGIILLFISLLLTLTYSIKSTALNRYLNDHETVLLEDVNLYGTSLNLKVNDTYQSEYSFYDFSNKLSISNIKTNESISDGINPYIINPGSYYILNNNKLLVSSSEIDLTYYTPTNNSQNYRINLKTIDGYLVYTKVLEQLPDDYYDIIIDPGHGGYDGGVIALDETTLESTLNLSVSQILKTKLELMGYKVQMTRNEDINPGSDIESQIDADVPSYCDTCRVGLVYKSHAPYTISIHHNSGGGSGYEVFSSYLSNSSLSSEIFDALNQVSTPSEKEIEGDVDGNYKYTYNKLEDGLEDLVVDYYYIIRETGGVATNSFKTESAQNIGSEAILIELGYVDNQFDYYYLINKDFQENEAQAIADGVNNYITKKNQD